MPEIYDTEFNSEPAHGKGEKAYRAEGDRHLLSKIIQNFDQGYSLEDVGFFGNIESYDGEIEGVDVEVIYDEKEDLISIFTEEDTAIEDLLENEKPHQWAKISNSYSSSSPRN